MIPAGTKVIAARHARPGMWIIKDNPRFNERIVDAETGRSGQILLRTDYGGGGEPGASFYEPDDLLIVSLSTS